MSKPEDQTIADHFSRLRIAYLTAGGVARAQLQTEMQTLREQHADALDMFSPMGWETE